MRFKWLMGAATLVVCATAWWLLRDAPQRSHGASVASQEQPSRAPVLIAGDHTPDASTSRRVGDRPLREPGQRTPPALPRPARPTIAIHILGSDGEPVPTCALTVSHGFSSKTNTPYEVHDGIHHLPLDRFERDPRTDRMAPTDLHVSEPRDADGKAMNALQAHLHNVDLAQETIVIRLVVGRIVRGTVSAEDETKLPDVQVVLRSKTQTMGYRRTKTDMAGHFQIAGLPAAELSIRVRPQSPWVPCAPITIAADQSEVRIVLDQGGPFAVRVLNADGDPVKSLQVRIQERDFDSDWRRTGKTDPAGVFETTGVPRHEQFQIKLDPRGASPMVPPFVAHGVAYGDGTHEIRLPRGVTIRGVLVDSDGHPVQGAARMVGRIKPTAFPLRAGVPTNAKGEFVIGNLAPGLYWMDADGGRGWANAAMTKVTAPSTGVRLVVPRAMPVTGTLETDDITGWRISWQYGRQATFAVIQPDGTFSINKAPEIPSALVASGPDGRYAMREDVLPSSGPFILRPEQGGEIAGRVTGADLQAMPMIVGGSRGHMMGLNALVQPDGRFVIEGVPHGLWRLTLYRSGEVCDHLDGIKAGARDVVLRATK